MNKRKLRFQLMIPDDDSMITDTLEVNNVSPQRIAFKVKTNNQTRYIVRPNAGTIGANDVVNIFINVHPEAKLPEAGPSKDKFLLRVAPCPGVDVLPPHFWTSRESDPTVHGLKILVEYVADNNIYSGDNREKEINGAVYSGSGDDDGDAGVNTGPFKLESGDDGLKPLSVTGAQLAVAEAGGSPSGAPSIPHVRDMPPDLLSAKGGAADAEANGPTHLVGVGSVLTPTTTTTATASGAGVGTGAVAGAGTGIGAGTFGAQVPVPPTAGQRARYASLGDPAALLSDAKYDDALSRVVQLEALLDEKNLELSRLKTELEETRAETDRVLKDAPVTPIVANKLISDPFGGVSVAGLGLMLLLFLLVVNIILRII